MRRLKAFGHFWYDFVVGDDWRIAAVVAVALAITWGLSRSTPHTWWVMPLAVAIVLPVSVWQVVRKQR
ncbi:MAG TPA: hypothetical protein VKB75_12700 [Jatrophihabitans sp.]|nr:hypothetical protein [Jatrophihabitans sp.]